MKFSINFNEKSEKLWQILESSWSVPQSPSSAQQLDLGMERQAHLRERLPRRYTLIPQNQNPDKLINYGLPISGLETFQWYKKSKSVIFQNQVCPFIELWVEATAAAMITDILKFEILYENVVRFQTKIAIKIHTMKLFLQCSN